ncbi:MAG: CYTH domain-containing protein [Bacteroidetes bacterium]|nr:MAG: CYTH domain-containing protein [Bacteroidota bacterium]
MPLNIEIKAKCQSPDRIHEILNAQNAEYRGEDHQIDTYFKVPHGRLKLREGRIENHLIHYFRDNQAGPKKSEVLLFKTDPGSNLKTILTTACGILTVVDKKRSIYYIENVKFHVDDVQGLGRFVEIEAIDTDGNLSERHLLEQCEYFMRQLQIEPADLLDVSYSDLLLQKQQSPE